MGTPELPRMPPDRDAIGGYFALEPAGVEQPTFHLAGHAFQSARAAFLALLEARRPHRVWLPEFLCDSMAEPLAQAGVEEARYALGPAFSPSKKIGLVPGDWLLAVNYFGLLNTAIDDFMATYPPEQLVIDNSQAFYAAPRSVLANLYSARKFLGVADGGFVVGHDLALADHAQDTGTPARSAHLTLRRDQQAEAGHAAFTQAEASLANQPPLRMSSITRELIEHADHARICEQRRRNYQMMAAHLDDLNELSLPLAEGAIPLCYPFVARASTGLRQLLWNARIYVPCYWPELLDGRRAVPARERRWASELLALPVDQRYDADGLAQDLVLPLRRLLAD
ncbi:MAG: hypothetical protein H7255_19610 [Ramlibacter sp.]|nr:hypothetical protein [Ramlibacter sp.]